jgi:HEAT repeat protein
MFAELEGVDDLLLPFLKQHLGDEDYWTPNTALSALAKIGARAKPAVVNIGRLLKDEELDNRLLAADLIQRLTSEIAFLDDQLRIVCKGSDTREWYSAIEAIARLKQDGDRYRMYLVEGVHAEDRDLAQFAIATLGDIETPAAIDALKKVAESKDWLLRSTAVTALQRLHEESATEN